MSEINLLPKARLSTSRSAVIARKLKLFNIVVTGVLLISLLVMGGLIVINSRTLTGLNTKLEQLRSSVYALRAVEGQYSLVKNRLAGIGNVRSQTGSDSEASSLGELVAVLPPGALVTDIGLTGNNTTLSLDLVDARALAEVISRVLSTGVYKSVLLESLGYKKDKGYQMSVGLTTK